MSSAKLPPGYLPPTREDAMQRAQEALSAEIVALERPRQAEAEQRPPIIARPFVWQDPGAIPLRNPVLGKFWPGFLSATIGAGAIGKSSRIIIDALEIATGRSIFHPPREPRNVWLWNLEDPEVEMRRRITAAMLHHKIPPEEIKGRLFLNARDSQLKLATFAFGMIRIDPGAVPEIIAMLRTFKVGVLFIDPLRNAHRVPENDNTAMGVVCDQLIEIANETQCAIDVAHHPRKGVGEELSIDDARGGGALGGALRAARLVQRMSAEEANLANVEEAKRKFYFRVNDDAKPNMGPGAAEAEWSRLISYDLGNGNPGDNIQVVIPWKMPGLLDGLTVDHLDALHTAMGPELYPISPRASDWLGYLLAKITGIDAEEPAGKKRLSAIIKTYHKAGQLIATTRKNPKHAGDQDCYGKPPG